MTTYIYTYGSTNDFPAVESFVVVDQCPPVGVDLILNDTTVFNHPAPQADPVGTTVAPVSSNEDRPGWFLTKPFPHRPADAYEKVVELFEGS